MKKPSKREQINLFFSAFLILGFGVCAYFFSTISGTSLSDNTIGKSVTMLIFVLFGLIIFYATRVGDGKQIKRFSIASLILVCLPAIYAIMAYIFEFVPLHAQISANQTAAIIAAFALGYGIPYTFLSGYEIAEEEEIAEEKSEEEKAALDEESVDYSEIKTLELESDENNDEEEKTEATAEEKTAEDDEISEDTEKTIQSILDEKSDK